MSAALREAAQQALEALEQRDNATLWHQAIHALRDALAQEEQKQVVYTGDVARTMLESGMTFHLGMPHAIVMKQMTRFYDLVCAEASLRAAAAFAIPPRREWQGLTTQEAMALTDTAPKGVFYGCDAGTGLGIWIAAVAAAERALKEKNA